MLSLDALIELFKTHLLPNDRKLRFFKEQPLKKLSEFSGNYCMLTFLVLSSKEQNIQYPIQYQHCHPGNKVSYNETYLTNIAFICAVWRMTEELSFVP